jgi:hypothetical protein
MRSDGLNLLSLLTQWLFNKFVASWFGWALSLKWYFSLKFVISSFTEGIWRSCWITQFGTNHGALTMILRTLDWKCSILSMSEMLDVPHSWHPYSQTGFRIALYQQFVVSWHSLYTYSTKFSSLHKQKCAHKIINLSISCTAGFLERKTVTAYMVSARTYFNLPTRFLTHDPLWFLL